MRVLVGGGTGFVGGALTQLLRSRGHEVTHVSRHLGPDRISWDELARSGLPPCDAAVNLAGENVLNPLRRWDDPFRRVVVTSRVATTKTLAKAIAEAERPPRAWVLVTGVGVVLGKGGGAVSQMLWPFRLGLGGPVGSGLQPFPWIHVRDVAGVVCHALETEGVHGVLNGVSPASPSTSNADFARELGSALGRPALLPLPSWAVRGVFGAERAVMLLEGQRVAPKRTLESGYCFVYPDLPSALRDIVS
ncbi:epimerase family protein SDR39U1 isoform X3 [Lepidochelys kempii]|uniref:epimerase family protein SDR39U1 isoform X3 n=1 Tax=Lepidochelys kempii TaxID=8472 RepID=UPI003C6F7CCB